MRESRNLRASLVNSALRLTHRGGGPGEMLPLGRGLDRVVEADEEGESGGVPIEIRDSNLATLPYRAAGQKSGP